MEQKRDHVRLKRISPSGQGGCAFFRAGFSIPEHGQGTLPEFSSDARKPPIGGSMFSSSNGYNATVVANDSSTMSVSITKNLASYVVTVNAGSNFAYGSIELSGGAFNVSTGASYAFS